MLGSTPAIIRHNDATRPMQENSAMFLKDWSPAAASETETIEITLMVPPLLALKSIQAREVVRLMYL